SLGCPLGMEVIQLEAGGGRLSLDGCSEVSAVRSKCTRHGRCRKYRITHATAHKQQNQANGFHLVRNNHGFHFDNPHHWYSKFIPCSKTLPPLCKVSSISICPAHVSSK